MARMAGDTTMVVWPSMFVRMNGHRRSCLHPEDGTEQSEEESHPQQRSGCTSELRIHPRQHATELYNSIYKPSPLGVAVVICWHSTANPSREKGGSLSKPAELVHRWLGFTAPVSIFAHVPGLYLQRNEISVMSSLTDAT